MTIALTIGIAIQPTILTKAADKTKYVYNGNASEIANYCFNAIYYADTYSDLKKAYEYDEKKLKNHWLTYGIREGRSASPVLNLKYYIQNNSDLKKLMEQIMPMLITIFAVLDMQNSETHLNTIMEPFTI